MLLLGMNVNCLISIISIRVNAHIHQYQFFKISSKNIFSKYLMNLALEGNKQ